jgi:hypothetical protein
VLNVFTSVFPCGIIYGYAVPIMGHGVDGCEWLELRVHELFSTHVLHEKVLGLLS